MTLVSLGTRCFCGQGPWGRDSWQQCQAVRARLPRLAAGLPASQARRRQLLEVGAGTLGVMEFKETNTGGEP